MTARIPFCIIAALSLGLPGCGGGSSSDNFSLNDPVDTPAEFNDPVNGSIGTGAPGLNTGFTEQARYRVTMENLWGVEDFPQGFPDDAHFSLIGGATHNAAVSFWDFGDVASRGMEDMAEAGLIDILLFDEVAPAIENGTADSMIEIREYTNAQIDGVPGIREFEITVHVDWPRVSMVTMLGPSPDWFVGVSGLSLLNEGEWVTQLTVDLPLYDAGTKSDITPIMGGPDIIPPDPIGLVAYDTAAGVYLPATEPQNVARLIFEKLPIVDN